MVKIDMTNIQYPDCSFDVVLCSHVLEHIPEDVKAMQELFRILSHGGWAILQVPIDRNRTETYEDFSITDPREREQHFGRYDHCRVYGADYRSRLESAGFEVVIEIMLSTFPPQRQRGLVSIR
jgi:ubiquinone/menaquinone biosynthesis C-methylase UbiE